MEIKVHRFVPVTRAEGPGVRACLWVQGCPIHCPGCAVPLTWPLEGGETWDVEPLAQRILNSPEAIEGVTFLGGEPFFQAEALAALGRRVREAGLSVLTFTGYTLEELRMGNISGAAELLAVSDLLIDGPYRADLADLSRPWVGSSNQGYHFLTERYRPLADKLHQFPNRWEIILQSNGTIQVNGMGDLESLKRILDAREHPGDNH